MRYNGTWTDFDFGPDLHSVITELDLRYNAIRVEASGCSLEQVVIYSVITELVVRYNGTECVITE